MPYDVNSLRLAALVMHTGRGANPFITVTNALKLRNCYKGAHALAKARGALDMNESGSV